MVSSVLHNNTPSCQRSGSELLIEGVPERVSSVTGSGQSVQCARTLFFPQVPTLKPPSTPQTQLILRAINSSKSAFMAVTLNARFFESYAVLNAGVVQAGVLLKVCV